MVAFLAPLALLGNVARVGRAGLGAYRTMKGIRAARAAAGQPMGFQKGLGAIQKGERKLFKKSPLTAGGLETALSAPIAAEGLGDVARGTMEGDYGQVASGLGGLALSVPFVGRGLRMTGASRKIPSSVSQPLYQTGKGIQQRTPKGTVPAGFALLGTGALTERDDVQAGQPGEPMVLGDPVQDILRKVEADKANIGKAAEIDGKVVIIGSPEYKTIAKQKLNEAYKQMEGGERKTSVTADQLASTFDFDLTETGGVPTVNEASLPPTPKPDDMSAGEIDFVAKKQEGDVARGQKIKEKMLRSKEADEFNNFYNRITNLTGGNDQTSNLLLFKLATGLISGKTAQSGVRGFLDVVGQAGGGVADTALALFSKEQDRRKDLAVAYLKAKEKEGGAGLIKAAKDRRTVLVRDPNLPFKKRTVEIGMDKERGTDVMFVPTPDGTGTMAVPMKYTEYTTVTPKESQLRKQRNQLNSIAQGYNFAQTVLKMPDGTFGLTGRGKLALEKTGAVVTDLFEFFGADLSSASSNKDAEIVELITEIPVDDAGNPKYGTASERKETQKVVNQYKSEIREILRGVGANTPDAELDNITRARLIETRMKYILANANKSEDRLTRADVDDAAASTKILGLTTGEDEVRSSYRNLMKDLEDQFRRIADNYVEGGGSEQFLLQSFQNMPQIANINAMYSNQQFQQNVAQNLDQTIGTIE
jgi:hypothetical protein